MLPVEKELLLPDFVEVPQDLKVTEGDEAVLSCKVTGQPTPDVTWYVEDKQVLPSDRVSVETNRDRHKLVIHKAELDDEGMYKCVAKSDAGKAICEVELLVEGKLGFIRSVEQCKIYFFGKPHLPTSAPFPKKKNKKQSRSSFLLYTEKTK